MAQFFDQNKVWFSVLDWFVYFLFVPLILVFVYLLPYGFKRVLVLNPQYPSVLSLYASNLVHASWGHLVDNLGLYALLMFLLLNLENNKNRLVINSWLFFTVLPFIISLTSLLFGYAFSISKNIFGFSGIVSGFAGYLLILATDNLKKQISMLHSLLILLGANLLVWCLANSSYLLLVVTATFLMILIIENIEPLKEISKTLKHLKPLQIFLYTVLLLTIITSLYSITKINTTPSITNIPAHLAGYFFGIISSIIFSKNL